jgi:hypothetical protein
MPFVDIPGVNQAPTLKESVIAHQELWKYLYSLRGFAREREKSQNIASDCYYQFSLAQQ